MSSWIYEAFVEPLGHQSFQKALIGGSLAAIVCGVIGCFVILRRMAFLGDALAHSMLAGVTAGYLFMQIVFGHEAHAPAMLLGSLLAGIITVFLIGFVSKFSRIKEDTSIGIMYTGIFSIGGILASYFSHRIHLDLYHFIAGMVLAVDDADLWMMAIVAAIVLSVVIVFHRQLMITSFDPIMAASLGISVMAFDYLLTACTSLVVVSAVSLVGVVLVVGLLVTPAATAYLVSDRLARMQVLAAVFGVTGVIAGLYVSTWIGNIATGPSIVLASWIQFLVVLVVAPRYGLIADWWRRRVMLPPQLTEDILGSFRKVNTATMTLDEMLAAVHGRADQVTRGVAKLEDQGLLLTEENRLRLTEAGHREARRLLRAHRLWETYLDHVGTPQSELHERAHQLEHVHDEETVDYLDDKLGHPLQDPHGAEIPEDFVHLVPGEVVPVSLLRQGHRAEVVRMETSHKAIHSGDLVEMGSRSRDGQLWRLRTHDGRQIDLDHDTADMIFVRLLE